MTNYEAFEGLDQPRQVTATDAIRRTDNAEVAAMIGVRAEGVAKEPAHARSLSARRDPDRSWLLPTYRLNQIMLF
ncbi:hypothetical protein ACXR2W_05780 [Leucobacter sp. HY1908]